MTGRRGDLLDLLAFCPTPFGSLALTPPYKVRGQRPARPGHSAQLSLEAAAAVQQGSCLFLKVVF